jgi:hypothetical protein
LIRQLKIAEYKVYYYESLFPQVTELGAASDDAVVVPVESGEECRYVADLEVFTREEKWQAALDRYQRRPKQNWEIGRDYERYIGWRYENEGYRVSFHGIAEGLEDLGRDLICSIGSKVEIVQCKRWAASKLIHEKHVNQLFGTTIMYALQNGFPVDAGLRGHSAVSAVLITTARLSETAEAFAEALGVKFKVIPYEDYPLIKCNIGERGERIYHLPFDQQYDRIVIERNRGECYVWTIAEAESRGFRRAFRWRAAA